MEQEEQQRRVRTHWVLRERYQRAAMIAAVLGSLLVLGPLALLVVDGDAAALASPQFLVVALAVLAAAALIPYQIVLSVGRRQWRRAR